MYREKCFLKYSANCERECELSVKTKRLLCWLLSSVTALNLFILTVNSEVDIGNTVKQGISAAAARTADGYRAYAETEMPDADESITLSNDKKEYKSGDSYTYNFDVPNDAVYFLNMDYVLKSRSDLELELKIDGRLPFSEAQRLIFHGLWENSEKRFDGAGNEIAPEQVLSGKAISAYAEDMTGTENEPYGIALAGGGHTLTLTVTKGTADINYIGLTPPEKSEGYTAPESSSGNRETVCIEGEGADYKTGNSLVPMSDNASPSVSPSNPLKGKLNYIGGSNWSDSKDTLTWSFSVKTSGYYSFAAMYRQNINLGAISYRSLKIDGKSPFEEAKRMKFKYSASWRYYSFGDKEPYLFWIDAGEHTLSLSVTSGEMADIYAELQDITSAMGDIYIDITMLVGETVDTYRSYELFNQIPDYDSRMNYCLATLKGISDKIEKLQEKTGGSAVSTVNGACEIFEKMLAKPYSAHKYKTAFYNAYTNLGALLGTVADMPLDIDRIYLIGDSAGEPDVSVPVSEKIKHGAVRFFSTFAADYDNISDSASENGLTIWVNWGRDQAQVLTALINKSFTPKYETEVTVRVVNATLIQGILAGKGPDVMLQMARTEPVNLAMRGALKNLREFEDFESVTTDFVSDATKPYEYKSGTYALPDTQTFDMLFIRTDIFGDLGLEVPKTWEEFSETATKIQRNNLQVYMPSTFYPTVLVQNGLKLYDEEKGISTLTEARQIQCFIEYTDWFTKYKFPKAMDSFFNRFRIGSAPMGISPYTLITQIEVAAPEIADRWTAVTLPGVKTGSGEINFSSSAEGTGCGITKLSKNTEKAWEFLKWWVSAETQTAYSENVESILGPIGRVATASNKAFSELDWSNDIVPALLSQRENTVNLPQLPGGYYVTRGIEQAYWNVVEQNANPTDTLIKWGDIVNNEMIRKKAEYE